MSLVAELPEWLDTEAWAGWLEMRKKIRKPPTQRAITLALRKLDQMRREGQNIVDVLDQSTLNCWVDLYPVRKDRVSQQMDTGAMWSEFRTAIRHERMPSDPAIVAFIQANGGLRRLGEMESRRIDFMRKDFDQAVKSARAH